MSGERELIAYITLIGVIVVSLIIGGFAMEVARILTECPPQ